MDHSKHILKFEYKNYKGEHGIRAVHPMIVWHGVSKFHTGAQFFLKAYDPAKGEERDFAMNDMIGESRWRDLAHLIEEESNPNRKDMLPVGHVILEQAELTSTGLVSQTVQRPDGSAYERIVDSEEAYSMKSREETMVHDMEGQMICVGDVVQMEVEEPLREFGYHGDWCQYDVRKCPGGYQLSYFLSQKGQVLPKGYTGGLLTDFIAKPGNMDLKAILSATVPIRSQLLKIVLPYKAPF